MMGHPFLLDFRPSICSVFLLGALSLEACDRADPHAARTTHCASFCNALEKCDDATDLLECRDHCASDEVRSEAYFKARAECGSQALSCNHWVNEVDSRGVDTCDAGCELIGCVDRKLDKLTLTQEQTQVCSSVSTKLNACDDALQPDVVDDECQRMSPSLSETYIHASQLCTERVCDRIQTCLDELADDYETDLRLFSGKLQAR